MLTSLLVPDTVMPMVWAVWMQGNVLYLFIVYFSCNNSKIKIQRHHGLITGEAVLHLTQSSKPWLYPCQSGSPGSCFHTVPWLTALTLSLCRHRGPGLLAISAKGQQEPSGLIKTSQLTRPHLETCIIYSGSLLRMGMGMKREAGRM